jgi:uncharacterized protein YbaA (DUF1428 family)
MEHGALRYWEGVGEDVKAGKVTSFPQSVQLKDDETVMFSWIIYESQEHRDRVNAKVMEDPRLKDMMDRLAYHSMGTACSGAGSRVSSSFLKDGHL